MDEYIQHNFVDAEFALSDVLDYIFQFLNAKDLLNSSLVCKSWYEVARREILKRGPERKLIPDTYSKEITDPKSKFHVYDLLKSKPYVSLLFVGPSFRERKNKKLERDVLRGYKKYFQHKLVAVGVDECIMDEKVIVSCPGLLGEPNGILGLFLPQYKNLKIKFVSYSDKYLDEVTEPIATKVINELKNEEHFKTTLMIFCNSYGGSYHIRQVLPEIKKQFKQKMYTLWGGTFDDKLKSIDCNKVESKDQEIGFFALSLSGPNLQSWSIVLNCYVKKSEIDQKLVNLRDNLSLKRHTIGLACGPRYVEDRSNTDDYANMYRNSHDLMHAVKQVFPNIPFMGIFNYGYHDHFGVDSISDDSQQPLTYSMAMSLMIITYD